MSLSWVGRLHFREVWLDLSWWSTHAHSLLSHIPDIGIKKIYIFQSRSVFKFLQLWVPLLKNWLPGWGMLTVLRWAKWGWASGDSSAYACPVRPSFPSPLLAFIQWDVYVRAGRGHPIEVYRESSLNLVLDCKVWSCSPSVRFWPLPLARD